MVHKEDKESTGLKRVIESMWEYVPTLLLWSVLGLGILIGKLWIDLHDVSIRVAENDEKLSSARLCEHVALCVAPMSSECKNNINRLSISFENHAVSTESLRSRLLNVEDKIYSLKRTVDNQSDVESRIEFLEKKIRK